MTNDKGKRDAVSPELDDMVGDALAFFLDALADGDNPGVEVCIEDARGKGVVEAFTEDGFEACMDAAQRFVVASAQGISRDGVGALVRYCITYIGCVDIDGVYQDAVISVFYERGMQSAYSAYVLFDGVGTGDSFTWTEPLPAGVEDSII